MGLDINLNTSKIDISEDDGLNVDLYGDNVSISEDDSDDIIIEITGLKSINKFIGLEDTPLYYDNGKFFKVENNKIIYADIEWSDISGDLNDAPEIVALIQKLIETTTGTIVNNYIHLHNIDQEAHPYIQNIIQENYNVLNEKIDNSQEELSQDITSLTDALDKEIEERQTADSLLSENLQEETLARIDAQTSLRNDISNLNTLLEDEVTARTEGDSSLENSLGALTDELLQEISNRQTQDNALQGQITSNFNTLNEKINTESNDRVESDTLLQNNIDTLTNNVNSLSSTVSNNYTTLDNKINSTKTELEGDIDALSTTVTNNYNDLSGSITSNVATLNNRIDSEVSTLNTAISTETTNRQNADNNLQSQIDAITASSDVTDIVGTYAQLQAYDTSTLPPNSIIKVLQDEHQNDETTYYRWVITGGVGAWVLIGEEGPYYTKSEADGRFVPQTRTINGKALSNNISLTATDVNALPNTTVIGDGILSVQKNGTTVDTFSANATENKSINITVPTDTSDLTNNAGFITSEDLPTVNNGTLDIQVNGTSVGTFTANQSGNTTANIVVPDSATWGNITGDIEDQTDLQDALDLKQDTLVAGTDLEIIKGSSTHNLPEGYTEVEYIQANGDAGIITSVAGNISTNVTLIANCTQVTYASQVIISDGYDGNGGTYFGQPSTKSTWGAGGSGTQITSLNVLIKTEFNISSTITNTFALNGTVAQGPVIQTFSRTSTVPVSNNYTNWSLFGSINKSNNTIAYPTYGKVYYVKFEQNNTVVAEYIPAIRNSDNEVGLYDIINDTFIGKNLGTGTLVAGEKVSPTTTINFTNESGYALQSDVNSALALKQDVLTAGTGIDITNNVISNTQTSAEWGNITGTLSNQTDLQDALDTKQDVLTAGTDLEIIQGTSVKLPEGFTQLEYIQFTGTQYINTGILGNAGIETDVTFSFDEVPRDNSVLASRVGQTRIYPIHIYQGWCLGYGSYYSTANIPVVDVVYNVVTALQAGQQTMTVNNYLAINRSDDTVYNTDIPMYLGAQANASSAGGTITAQGFVKIKLYRIKIKSNGVLVLDGVPCNNNGTIGLYDLVSETLLTNQGTGSFVAGAEVPSSTIINFTNETGYTTNKGTVTSVNNIQPDASGNVTIETGGTVDQIFDGESINAQSGIAIQDVLNTKQDLLTAGTDLEIIAGSGAILPQGYTEVEYIQSSGTQYINVPYKVNNKTKFYCRYMQTALNTSDATGINIIFGTSSASELSKASFGLSRICAGLYSINFVGWGDDTSGSSFSINGYDSLNTWYEAYYDLNKIYINNTLVGTSATNTSTTWIAPYNLGLFAGMGQTVSAFSICRISVAWAEENGVLVLKLIPARREADGKLGMYDIVNNTFLTNAGTGVFVAGSDVIYQNETIINFTNESGYILSTQLQSALENYYTKSQTYTKTEINQLIADIPKFTVSVVQSLPATGEAMTLYLVPKTGTNPDVYNEYVWIESTSSYELIGSTAVDLSDYYNKTETDTLLNAKQDTLTVGAGIDITGTVISIDEDVVAKKTDLPTVNEGVLTLQVNSETKQTFNANSAENKTFNVSVPTTAGEVHALPDTTKYGKTISFTVDSTTYVLTAQLKDQDGTVLSTQTIDLPIESMVLNVDFDEDTNELIIELQNGTVTRVPIGSIIGGLQSEITSTNMLSSDLVDDTNNTHKFVTANEKTQISTNTTDIETIQNTLSGFGDIVTHNIDEVTQKITALNPTLTSTSGVCTWTITNSLETADVNVTVKEVSTNEEVIVGVVTTANTITIKMNSIANISANTYKAIIIG